MKLLYTITAYPPSIGGAQLHAHLLAQEIAKNHEIEVVNLWDENRSDWLLGTTVNAPTDSKTYCYEGISVHKIGISPSEKKSLFFPTIFYYANMKGSLPKIGNYLSSKIEVFSEGIDIIHNFRIGREGITFASCQIARKRGIPFAFTPFHHPRWKGWRYEEYLKLYRQADVLFALTSAEKQILAQLGVDERKIVVIGTGPVLAAEFNPERFINKFNVRGPFILFLGQHYRYKGYQQVLQAANQVWMKFPNAEFVFIGPQLKETANYFKKFTDKRIHLLGNVDLQTKTDAIAACSLLCVPSTQESFGGVYTEAWSLQKPVIGCDIPAVSELIDDGQNGLLTKQDANEIAERIIFLLNNPEIAAKMGSHGQNKALTNFAWPRLATIVEETYNRLL